jgi:hypothetical protein
MADVPEERASDEDLYSLNAREQLERIQELLTLYSPDAVRKILVDRGYDVDDLISRDPSMDLLSAKDLLDTPFFDIEGLGPIPDETGLDESRKMTANVSTTKRKVLDNYYTYSVGFEYWENFVEDVRFEDLDKEAILTKGSRNWATLLVKLLKRSFGMGLKQAGEIAELAVFENVFNVVVKCFGFDFAVVSGSDCDVEVRENKNPFLFLEGKESSHLPRRITKRPQLWSELCLFGFATKIARTKSLKHEAERQELAEKLGLRKPNEKLAETEHTPSAMVDALLLQTEQCIGPLVKQIREQRRGGHIEDTDAINLWAAVMQACHYSVAKGQNRSIVVSARMFWFIQLDTTQDNGTSVLRYKCCVKISDAHRFGSPSFMRTLVSFMKHAAEEKRPLNDAAQKLWEIALTGVEGKSGSMGKRPTQSSESGPKPKKPKAGDQQGASTKTINAAQTRDCEVAMISTAVSVDESDEPMGTDEYGVIPWFEQIDETNSKVLGVGRAGKVTKVQWNGQDVALKTFSLQHDDERSLHDVYKHELDVVCLLRPLWGKYVPTLLFHKPWQTSPMIGLQLGEQLEDDMSNWSKEDYKSAEATMEEVKKLGWEQDDVRGANFIRLTGPDNIKRIAMIDFESLRPTRPSRVDPNDQQC